MADNPITRKEKYLAKLTGSYTGNVPDPITRVEKYLYDLCQKGISGLTPEEIENAVNKYLEGKDYVTKTDADKAYQPAGSYLSGTDEDLAVSGKAADAKAVGNAVAKIEGINYTDRGTLADTDAFMVNDGTGMKKGVLSKLSDFVLNKIADKVFEKLQTNDKTILGAINELNSNKISNNRFSVIHIRYSDSDVSEIGGLDNCIIDALANTIPKDGAFYGTFTANIQYLMLGYRYITGKFGTIVLFDFNNNTRRWNINNGKITKA